MIQECKIPSSQTIINGFCTVTVKEVNSYEKWSLLRSRLERLPRKPKKDDSGVQNPIVADDYKWILHRNCEGSEQLQKMVAMAGAED